MCEREQILAVLKDLGIAYLYKEHPPAETYEQNMENVAEFRVSPVFCKNLLLTTRRKTACHLLLLPYLKRFQTAQASRAIGSVRLSLAPDERLWAYLRCKPGSVSGLGLLFDTDKAVQLSADRELLAASHICFHPNDNRATVCMETRDFFETFAPATGHPPHYVELVE